MNMSILGQEIYENFRAGALIVAVPMAVAIAIGLFLAIFQAATQIQDQTLPQLVKVGVIFIVLAGFGYPLSIPLIDHTRVLFSSFHLMTR